MLASPLLPAPTFPSQHTSDESTHYRPSRDLESFNSLLPPPIEFVEGSSSGALAVPDGKYEPINTTPKAQKTDRLGSPKPTPPPPSPGKVAVIATNSASAKTTSLYPDSIDATWPSTCNRASGLHNNGNTCFMNSALQCLLHTPPLLRVLIAHQDKCRIDKGFCMTCSLRQVAVQAHSSKSAFSPLAITSRLQTIAKHMRKGRQEDSHEFLRYAIDALQKSCLAGLPPKIDAKLAETTWVHKIFGGRLRSRVTCHDCGHNSDTFDRILDLSLDIFKLDTLKDALRKFVAIDYLKGADKYKCEKCKKPVIAEKRFSLHEAPLVLTVHLKRFSPLGRKIGHQVAYEEQLLLQPYMSEGQYGPSYSLYGVICHAGGGPNSGHYYAYVKSRDNRWWDMNDELVSLISGPPMKTNAYMLFYIRNKGQGLEAAIQSSLSPQLVLGSQQRNGLAAGMKKRRDRETEVEEDKGTKVSTPFIGPVLPSSLIDDGIPNTKRPRLSEIDPQAAKIKTKIAAQKAQKALDCLGSYESDNDEDGAPVKFTDPSSELDMGSENPEPTTGAVLKSSPMKSSPPPAPPSSSPGVSPSSFYASLTKKRKSPERSDVENVFKNNARQRLPIGNRTLGYREEKVPKTTNPFNRMNTYSKKSRRLMGI